MCEIWVFLTTFFLKIGKGGNFAVECFFPPELRVFCRNRKNFEFGKLIDILLERVFFRENILLKGIWKVGGRKICLSWPTVLLLNEPKNTAVCFMNSDYQLIFTARSIGGSPVAIGGTTTWSQLFSPAEVITYSTTSYSGSKTTLSEGHNETNHWSILFH